MPCYNPLRPYEGPKKDNGKISIVYKKGSSWVGKELKLPCGQCVGCRLERARQWAVRCMHEASLYEDNCFVTLTYSDENLPGKLSLKLEDWQNFMKRLRKESGKGIRFYQCGEYGEKLKRPHFHAIIFNYDFKDKKLFKNMDYGRLYTSELLDKVWNKGFATIGDVNFDSAGYVARYAMKKVTGEKAKEFYGERRPEFSTMSRRPGIGAGWYEKYKKELYPSDEVIVNGKRTKPPKYYDYLLDKEDSELLNSVKESRKNKLESVWYEKSRNGVIRVDDNDSFRLPVREVVKKAQIKFLKRSME